MAVWPASQTSSPLMAYEYSAEIIKVYDGDTVTAIVDLGFSVKMKMRIRLTEINAPEVRGEEKTEGLKSRDFLREKILNKTVTIKTEKTRGKYGRYIATIYLEGENINELLVKKGLAEHKTY